MKQTVRLVNIRINNFKNICNGELSFVNSRNGYKASVLGLYGQNGSGKTALIDAIELLKEALCGQSINRKFADYINIDSDTAAIEYSFEVSLEGIVCPVAYTIEISRRMADSESNKGNESYETNDYVVDVSREELKCNYISAGNKIRFVKVIDTAGKGVFSPASKYAELTGGTKEVTTDLIVAKILAREKSSSFIFSSKFLSAVKKNADNIDDNDKKIKVQMCRFVLSALAEYGNDELFIINTSNSGLITMDAMPFAFKIRGEKTGTLGTIAIPIDKPEVVSERVFNITCDIIDNMNIVLEQIVPGLTIGVRILGNQLMADGKTGIRIELVSRRDNKEIALKYESEGIKKIISVLQLLVVVYNQESITVAIDELDSGIFEYLLGELLRIISEKGKGQLIFTSHNLRPLETLDKGFIAFTTTNPDKRYIRMTNVQENNNLRDFYYRDIMLGEQDEEVYDETNNSEIAFAFREAGEVIGS